MAKDSVKKEGGGGAVKKRPQQHGSAVKKRQAGSSAVKKEEGDALPIEKRKPGQKYSTPTPGQADRVFYETLLKQRPQSHMAQEWCLSYGVCGGSEAEVLYKTVCKRKGVQPSSSAPPLNTSPVKKERKSSSAGGGKSRPKSSLPRDMEADTGFEPSNVFEGVGTTGF